jgi:hypothetical protein
MPSGHELIPKFQHTQSLLTAPMEMVKEGQPPNSMNCARRYVEEVDKAHVGSRACSAPIDASRYDLVVNLGHMSVALAKQLIVDAAHAPDYRMTPASKRAFENFALASRVRATLALAEDLSQVRVEVDANDGEFRPGRCRNGLLQVVTHIEAIPGIKQVRANLDAAGSRHDQLTKPAIAVADTKPRLKNANANGCAPAL